MEPSSHLVPGIDYPRTFQEFDARFPNEEACKEYLFRLRWPDGFVCPHCKIPGNPWTTARGLLFHRLAQQTVATDPTPFKNLVSCPKSKQ
jgi:hypothetical protein